MAINKTISVWRGDSTPPTIYHKWEKIDTDGTYLGTFTYRDGEWKEDLQEIKETLADAVMFDENDNVPLREGTKILGKNEHGQEHELIGLAEYEISGDIYDQIEVGSESTHLNLNTNDDPNFGTYVTVDTPDGKKIIDYFIEWTLSELTSDTTKALSFREKVRVGDTLIVSATEKVTIIDKVLINPAANLYLRYIGEADTTLYQLSVTSAGALTTSAATWTLDSIPNISIAKGGTGATSRRSAASNLKVYGFDAPNVNFTGNDLNNVNPGAWYVSDTQAATIANSPVIDSPFRFHTVQINSTSTTGRLFQQLISTKGIYYRFFENGDWSDWTEVNEIRYGEDGNVTFRKDASLIFTDDLDTKHSVADLSQEYQIINIHDISPGQNLKGHTVVWDFSDFDPSELKPFGSISGSINVGNPTYGGWGFTIGTSIRIGGAYLPTFTVYEGGSGVNQDVVVANSSDWTFNNQSYTFDTEHDYIVNSNTLNNLYQQFVSIDNILVQKLEIGDEKTRLVLKTNSENNRRITVNTPSGDETLVYDTSVDNKIYGRKNQDWVETVERVYELTKEIIPLSSIRIIEKGSDGNIYAGSSANNGIFTIDENHNMIPTNVTTGYFYHIHIASDGMTYFGGSSTSSPGLYRLENTGDIVLYDLSDKVINFIKTAHNGTTLVGTTTGLYKLELGVLTLISSLASWTTMFNSNIGETYFLRYVANGGIYKLDQSNNTVSAIVSSGQYATIGDGSDGNIYIGNTSTVYNYMGVRQLNPSTNVITVMGGFPTDTLSSLYAVTIGPDGTTYFSGSGKGVWTLNIGSTTLVQMFTGYCYNVINAPNNELYFLYSQNIKKLDFATETLVDTEIKGYTYYQYNNKIGDTLYIYNGSNPVITIRPKYSYVLTYNGWEKIDTITIDGGEY